MDFDVRHYGLVGSTMDVARSLIAEGCPARTIVLADKQAAGRGRLAGRSWEGSEDASLLMTLALRCDSADVGVFPLKVGLAVNRVLTHIKENAPASLPVERTKPHTNERPFLVKWPNDIVGLSDATGAAEESDNSDTGAGEGHSAVYAYKKLCGILCEATKGWLLAGIGLNLRRNAYPAGMSSTATSLEEVFGGGNFGKSFVPPDPEFLARSIGASVVSNLENPRWKEDYEQAMWGLGEEVRFVVGHPEGGETVHGRIEGIDGSGRLLLKNRSGAVEAFLSGEISHVRRA